MNGNLKMGTGQNDGQHALRRRGSKRGALRRAAAGEAGIGKLTLAVFLPILAAGLIGGYHVLPFYYYFFSIQNHMKQMVRVSGLHTDKEIKDKLWKHIRWYEIPAKRSALKIRRVASSITITLDYQEVFALDFGEKEYVIHVFDFHALAEGMIEKG